MLRRLKSMNISHTIKIRKSKIFTKGKINSYDTVQNKLEAIQELKTRLLMNQKNLSNLYQKTNFRGNNKMN